MQFGTVVGFVLFEHMPRGSAVVAVAVGVDIQVRRAGGEVTGIADWMPGVGRPYRTAFQMIDSDRLCNPTDYHLGTYPYMRNGVEVDTKGRPIAYWFRNSHPSEGPFHDYSDLSRQKWTRIPANRPWGRDNVLHIFEQIRLTAVLVCCNRL